MQPTIRDEGKAEYRTEKGMGNEDNNPFVIDGQPVGRIHHDAGGVPYLCIHDENGNTHHIYGYDQIFCADGGGGEWFPQKRAQDKMLAAWRKNRKDLQKLAGLLRE